MKQLRNISRKAASFAHHLFPSGGNATLAACRAGFAPKSARAAGTRLLSSGVVLELIAGQILLKAPGHEKVLARLMRPARPARSRLRLRMLLEQNSVPVLAEDPATGGLRLTVDPAAEALTAYAVSLTSGNLGAREALFKWSKT